VLRAAGAYYFIFFIIVVMFGAYYVVNLVLAVVAASYEKEARIKKEAKEEEQRIMLLRKRKERMVSSFNSFVNVTTLSSSDRKSIKFNKCLLIEDYSTSSLQHPESNRPLHQDTISLIRKGHQRQPAQTRIFNHVTSLSLLIFPGIIRFVPCQGHHCSVKIHFLYTLQSKVRMQLNIHLKNIKQKYCSWTCCPAFLKVQEKLVKVVSHSLFEGIITVCIIINTLMLSIDYYNAPYSEDLEEGNKVLTVIFIAEAVLKILALNPVPYIKNPWNAFDFIIVCLSILDLGLSAIDIASFDLSIMRSLRMLRIFKLAKNWRTLNVLITIIFGSLKEMGNLTLIVVIVIYIFAVIGMQLVGQDYKNADAFPDKEVPRWNFTNFYASFLMVFRILCGEWLEPLYDCLRCSKIYFCIPLFLLTFITGNFLVLNLFLALLLNFFSGDKLTATKKKNGTSVTIKKQVQDFLLLLRLTKPNKQNSGKVEPVEKLGNSQRKKGKSSHFHQQSSNQKPHLKDGLKCQGISNAGKLSNSGSLTSVICFNLHLYVISFFFNEGPLQCLFFLKECLSTLPALVTQMEVYSQYCALAKNQIAVSSQMVQGGQPSSQPKSIEMQRGLHVHCQFCKKVATFCFSLFSDSLPWYHGSKTYMNSQKSSLAIRLNGSKHLANILQWPFLLLSLSYSAGSSSNIITACTSFPLSGNWKSVCPSSKHLHSSTSQINTGPYIVDHTVTVQSNPLCLDTEQSDTLFQMLMLKVEADQIQSAVPSHQEVPTVSAMCNTARYRYKYENGSAVMVTILKIHCNIPFYLLTTTVKSQKLDLLTVTKAVTFSHCHSKEKKTTTESTFHKFIFSSGRNAILVGPTSNESLEQYTFLKMTPTPYLKNGQIPLPQWYSEPETLEEAQVDPGIEMQHARKEDNTEASEDAKKNSNEMQPCFPVCCSKCCCCGGGSSVDTPVGEICFSLRMQTFRLVNNRVFDAIVLFVILASTATLTLDDKYTQSNAKIQLALKYLDYFYTAFFNLEMILKIVGLGLTFYFTNVWTLLDFFLVVVGWLGIIGSSVKSLKSLRSLRTLRALRPLRAISRWEGMRLVVNALVASIPSISNVMLVCLVFWLIFGIVGVQIYGGKFFQCLDENGNRLPITVVNNRSECESNANKGYQWVNAEINFDNILSTYIILLQVATFEGWVEIMAIAADTRGVDIQPETGANIYSLLYFVAFIVVGSFFTLNLFIGVIIDNFNTVHKRSRQEGALVILLTEDQKRLYGILKRLTKAKPKKTIPPPENKFLFLFYKLVNHKVFEPFNLCLIVLNVLVMASDHYNLSEDFSVALYWFNLIFTALFTVEAILKLLGLRLYYFTQAWNIFDILVVVFSIVGNILDSLSASLGFSPTILRVFRVVRLGRLLRLVRSLKGIRKLLYTLIVSIPALFNIGLLLTLVMFIYSILGMNLFRNLPRTEIINDFVNFETFANSMLLLFRLTTAAGWNEILQELLVSDIQPSIVCVIYMSTYIIITFLVIVNMYVAIILENFNEAQEQELAGITDDDIDMYYEVWSTYDPYATQFIAYEQLSDFLDELKPPLKIPKPNAVKIAALNLPLTNGHKLHCLDILKALSCVMIGNVTETDPLKKLHNQINEKSQKTFPIRLTMQTVSTTLMIRKEIKAAMTIQKAFRKWQQLENKTIHNYINKI
uniref:Sodium channel protein n=1 Tax=Latimeria chalumnae TaxID=7897 RepID=H3AX65_LATCH